MTSFPFFSIAKSGLGDYGEVLRIAKVYEALPSEVLERYRLFFGHPLCAAVAAAVLAERKRREVEASLPPAPFAGTLFADARARPGIDCGAW